MRTFKARKPVLLFILQADQTNLLSVLGTLLGWISETQLRQTVETMDKFEKQSSTEHDVNLEITCERCLKVSYLSYSRLFLRPASARSPTGVQFLS